MNFHKFLQIIMKKHHNKMMKLIPKMLNKYKTFNQVYLIYQRKYIIMYQKNRHV